MPGPIRRSTTSNSGPDYRHRAQELCDAEVWDGPTRLTCGRLLIDGECGRHGRRPLRVVLPEGES